MFIDAASESMSGSNSPRCPPPRRIPSAADRPGTTNCHTGTSPGAHPSGRSHRGRCSRCLAVDGDRFDRRWERPSGELAVDRCWSSARVTSGKIMALPAAIFRNAVGHRGTSHRRTIQQAASRRMQPPPKTILRRSPRSRTGSTHGSASTARSNPKNRIRNNDVKYPAILVFLVARKATAPTAKVPRSTIAAGQSIARGDIRPALVA